MLYLPEKLKTKSRRTKASNPPFKYCRNVVVDRICTAAYLSYVHMYILSPPLYNKAFNPKLAIESR